jgi:hypothetical protein
MTTTLEQVDGLYEIADYMQDEELTAALEFIAKIILKPDIPADVAVLQIVRLQAIAATRQMTMNHVSRRMNDFQICENSNEMVNYRTFENDKAKFHKRPATWSPRSALVEHKAMKKFIEDNYDSTKINVVCTHHAPSKGSEHPRYAHDTLMNGAYNSNLDDFIMERPMIKLWTHGHTHEDFDYMIKGCRVVCNPRGYINYEDRADRFELKFVEV